MVKTIAHGKKITTLTLPSDHFNRDLNPVHRFGLFPLLQAEFKTISSVMVTTLSERWHDETNNFHLHFREMIVTLDDVECLLHIPMEGNMLRHEKQTSNEYNVVLMIECC